MSTNFKHKLLITVINIWFSCFTLACAWRVPLLENPEGTTSKPLVPPVLLLEALRVSRRWSWLTYLSPQTSLSDGDQGARTLYMTYAEAVEPDASTARRAECYCWSKESTSAELVFTLVGGLLIVLVHSWTLSFLQSRSQDVYHSYCRNI